MKGEPMSQQGGNGTPRSDADLFREVSEFLWTITDMGPYGEGWKSEELKALTAEVERRADQLGALDAQVADTIYKDWAYTWRGAVVMLSPFLAGLIVCLLWAALEGQLWGQ